MSSLIKFLPKVRGSYRENVLLSKSNWFNVGGPAEILFKPADTEDLSYFLKHKPKEIPVNIIGVGSNLLIRDNGVKGVVIKLGRNFTSISNNDLLIEVGAACLDYNLSLFCRDNSIGGLEFFSGIPGSVGGALAMNAGAYGGETSDFLVHAELLDEKGELHLLSSKEIGFTHRGNNLPKEYIFTKAVFKGYPSVINKISNKIAEIQEKRNSTQPIRSKTSGSSFVNPDGYKAWELIDQAGCRGLRIGGAVMSEKHCNFMINDNNATAKDLEELGKEVQRIVFAKTGIELKWEIKIIGDK